MDIVFLVEGKLSTSSKEKAIVQTLLKNNTQLCN